MVNSGFLDGLEVAEAKKKIIDWLEEKKLGTGKTNYKLRDWVFSRQSLLGRADSRSFTVTNAAMWLFRKVSFLWSFRT